MRMIISAGGTGGHIYPALAIIKEFQKKEKDFEVLYIGTHNRMENKIVPEAGIPYKSLKIYGFSKKEIIRDFKNLGYIIKSYKECIKIMEDFKPDIVVGVGGYVTFPVIMAAKKLKIKCVVHEQNSIPGKTNKFLSRGVDAVFTTFEMSNKYFSNSVNVIYTGNPCGDNIFNLTPMKKESLGFSKDKKLLLITSGSLGSSTFNTKIVNFLKRVKDTNYEVLFITGNSSYDSISKNKFPDSVKVVPYLNNLSSLLKSCDLIISRAGAGIITEIIVSKVPSILVPSPYVANNHQYYNAKDLFENDLAIMIEENNIDSDNLYKLVNSLLNEDATYKKIKNNLKNKKYFSSSEKIYNSIKEIVKNG